MKNTGTETMNRGKESKLASFMYDEEELAEAIDNSRESNEQDYRLLARDLYSRAKLCHIGIFYDSGRLKGQWLSNGKCEITYDASPIFSRHYAMIEHFSEEGVYQAVSSIFEELNQEMEKKSKTTKLIGISYIFRSIPTQFLAVNFSVTN